MYHQSSLLRSTQTWGTLQSIGQWTIRPVSRFKGVRNETRRLFWCAVFQSQGQHWNDKVCVEVCVFAGRLVAQASAVCWSLPSSTFFAHNWLQIVSNVIHGSPRSYFFSLFIYASKSQWYLKEIGLVQSRSTCCYRGRIILITTITISIFLKHSLKTNLQRQTQHIKKA